MTRRLVHRSDVNATELTKVARDLGMLVTTIGKPVDLLVGYKGIWILVEVKSAKGTYTPAQKKFKERCESQHLPVITWKTVGDVFTTLNAVNSWSGDPPVWRLDHYQHSMKTGHSLWHEGKMFTVSEVPPPPSIANA